MKTEAGIWIDREHAIVVLIDKMGEELRAFHAGVSEPFPQTSETRARHEYTRNDFVAEDKLERKQSVTRHDMYDEVMKYVGNVEALYVLGPGEAKKEFQSHLAAKGLSKVDIELEASDKMTDPQLIAKIRKHFKAVPK